MNDRELCEMFGITLEEVEREVDKIEAGDYSDWDFSRAMMGSPMREEKMKMISAPVGESRIAAMLARKPSGRAGVKLGTPRVLEAPADY